MLFAELEMKLHEAETEKFNIKQMKDLFEQKAAQLATEIVGRCQHLGGVWVWVCISERAPGQERDPCCEPADVKSRYDEEKSLREAAEQQGARLVQDLQREKQEKEKLHTELVRGRLSLAASFQLFADGYRSHLWDHLVTLVSMATRLSVSQLHLCL